MSFLRLPRSLSLREPSRRTIPLLRRSSEQAFKQTNPEIPEKSSAREAKLVRSRRAKRSLLRLPPEILVKIAAYLPAVPKACLALSCKYCFCHLAKEALSAKELQFPRLVSAPRREPIPVTLPMDRWEFLGMLENDRLLYCSHCLKIQPAKSFDYYQARCDRSLRYCKYGFNAGVVEICPCIRFTFGDKLRLAQYLMSPRVLSPDRSYLEDHKDLTRSRDGILSHECSHNYNRTKIQLKTEAMLVDRRVVFRTKFDITTARNNAYSSVPNEHIEGLPIEICEHCSIYHLLLCRPKKLEHPDSECVSARVCDSCNTSLSGFTEVFNAGQALYSWTVTRGLGKAQEEADTEWHDQINRGYRKFSNEKW